MDGRSGSRLTVDRPAHRAVAAVRDRDRVGGVVASDQEGVSLNGNEAGAVAVFQCLQLGNKSCPTVARPAGIPQVVHDTSLMKTTHLFIYHRPSLGQRFSAVWNQ